MRILLLIAGMVMVMVSCSKTTPPNPTPSPYPSVPLWASWEALLPEPNPENNPAGMNYSAKWANPVWSVEVTGNTATLIRPVNNTMTTSTFTVNRDDKGSIIVVRSVKGDFFLNLMKWTCQDGVWETKYTYTASVNVGAEVLKGCANKK